MKKVLAALLIFLLYGLLGRMWLSFSLGGLFATLLSVGGVGATSHHQCHQHIKGLFHILRLCLVLKIVRWTAKDTDKFRDRYIVPLEALAEEPNFALAVARNGDFVGRRGECPECFERCDG